TPALSEAVHSRIESLRSAEYLMAGRAHGVAPWRLLWIHGVLAGCGRLIARQLVLCFTFFIAVETTLAYIGGFGAQEPTPSWGNMLAFEWGWSWTALAPAAALWITIASLTWIADGLREVAVD
ncbi:MAG: hypothetical protein GWP91_21075, partial [Rhodobacterales bacterium]|nr:hypothetical protein [Rhodobacterales bacterium]